MSRSHFGKAMLAGGAAAAALLLAAAVSTPDHALAEYRRRLAALVQPPNIFFAYADVRSGPARVIAEEHQVYRTSSGLERNAILAINGTKVSPPRVSITRVGEFPYDVAKFAVDPVAYDLWYAGRTTVAGKSVYAFTVKRRTPNSFAIDGLYLDAREFLPVRETFTARSGGCAGAGSIDFARAGAYWLPVAVRVSCSVAPPGSVDPGAKFKESIRFSGYRFPKAIPPQVFGRTPQGAGPAVNPGP